MDELAGLTALLRNTLDDLREQVTREGDLRLALAFRDLESAYERFRREVARRMAETLAGSALPLVIEAEWRAAVLMALRGRARRTDAIASPRNG